MPDSVVSPRAKRGFPHPDVGWCLAQGLFVDAERCYSLLETAMPHFILRNRGSGSAPADVLSRLRSLPNTAILDASSDRMLLVDGSEGHLRAALSDMPGWVMTPEQTIPLPDSRQKILQPPADLHTEEKS